MSPLKRKSLWKWMKMDEGNLEVKFPHLPMSCYYTISTTVFTNDWITAVKFQLPSLKLKGPIWCLRALASVLVVCTWSWEWFSFWYFAYATGNLDSVHLSLCREKFRETGTDTNVYLLLLLFFCWEKVILKVRNILAPFNFFFFFFWFLLVISQSL